MGASGGATNSRNKRRQAITGNEESPRGVGALVASRRDAAGQGFFGCLPVQVLRSRGSALTPATTGPELIPMRSSKPRPPIGPVDLTASSMSSAINARVRAWSSRGDGIPAAAM